MPVCPPADPKWCKCDGAMECDDAYKAVKEYIKKWDNNGDG